MADFAGIRSYGSSHVATKSRQSIDGTEAFIAKFVSTSLPLLCGVGTLNAYVLNEMWSRLQDPDGMLPVLDALRSVHARLPYELPCFLAAFALVLLSWATCCTVLAHLIWDQEILAQTSSSPLASYELGARLGEGAFGAVYRATKLVPTEDGLSQRDFALKIISVQRMKEANDGIAEAMRLARVDHRCVVHVHEHFFDKTVVSWKDRLFGTAHPLRLCIAQELCSGDLQSDIRSWAKATSEPQSPKSPKSPTRQGRPDWPQLLRIFQEIVEGLEALHKRGIIHRDLKPANIFVSQDHKHVRIGDLGIAENVEKRQMDIVGLGKAGTPGYMAPEVSAGIAYSTRADNWSLGCLLVDMAYPTEHGGWSVQLIVESKGFSDVTMEGVTHVLNHESLIDNPIARKIVEHSLVEDPHTRWGCADVLSTLTALPSVKSAFITPLVDSDEEDESSPFGL